MQKQNLSKEVPTFYLSPNLTPTERVEVWKRSHNHNECLGYVVGDIPTAKPLALANVDGLSRVV